MKNEVASLAAEQALYPQEAPARLKKEKSALLIGIPRESYFQEKRVALKPESVQVLAANGHTIIIESGAGKASNYTDSEYSEAGAQVVHTAEEVYKAHIILKVEPPTDEEIILMQEGTSLISALQSVSRSEEYFRALNRKKITALAYEFIEDIVGGLPIVRAMSEIAGSAVMPIAAEYLSSTKNGLGVLLGGITGVPPTKVVILGAGTVAEFAARAAIGFGAQIMVFDNHVYKLRRLKHAVGQHLFTSTIDHAALEKAIADADVVIGAIRPEKGLQHCVVTEEMVASMRPGSVIIDVSIDHGGCFETSEITSHNDPVFHRHGIKHYCVPNIASRVARTASNALSNIITPIILGISDAGGVEEMIHKSKWFMRGVYTNRGSVTNAHIARKFNLPLKDLNLITIARF